MDEDPLPCPLCGLFWQCNCKPELLEKWVQEKKIVEELPF